MNGLDLVRMNELRWCSVGWIDQFNLIWVPELLEVELDFLFFKFVKVEIFTF